MKLVEVNDKRTIRDFLELPVGLYKEHPNWIRPLDKDIEAVFDPKINPNFKNGEAIRYILVSDSGKTIGRVAAFINENTKNAGDFPVGGMGFFECIDDKQAAF